MIVGTTLTTSQGICLLHVYIPVMCELGLKIHFIRSGYIFLPSRVMKYIACVSFSVYEDDSKVDHRIWFMSLPGLVNKQSVVYFVASLS